MFPHIHPCGRSHKNILRSEYTNIRILSACRIWSTYSTICQNEQYRTRNAIAPFTQDIFVWICIRAIDINKNGDWMVTGVGQLVYSSLSGRLVSICIDCWWRSFTFPPLHITLEKKLRNGEDQLAFGCAAFLHGACPSTDTCASCFRCLHLFFNPPHYETVQMFVSIVFCGAWRVRELIVKSAAASIGSVDRSTIGLATLRDDYKTAVMNVGRAMGMDGCWGWSLTTI